MKTKEKGKLIGLIGALVVHVLLLIFLIWVTIITPEPEEESGVPILMGEVDYAIGGERVAHYVDVEVLPVEPKVEPVVPVPNDAVDEVITQTEEETVVIPPKKEPKKKPEKTPEEKVKELKQKEAERIERERKEAEEAKKREIERKERERKEAEAAARRRVSNAFGKGAEMDGEDKSTQKVKDAFDGVPTTGVSASGQSGYGSFDLGGRSLGKGGLPRPVYNVPEEGKVVVAITVNPEGKVISTSISPQTNTVSVPLRRAAEQAAKKAQFNRINSVDNQVGTITYFFNLK